MKTANGAITPPLLSVRVLGIAAPGVPAVPDRLSPTLRFNMCSYIALTAFSIGFASMLSAQEVRIISAGDTKVYILPVGNEDRIAVRRYDPRDLAELSLFSSDNQHGGHIEEIKWSDDHKYLVFSTSNSGGHSPWHFPTYVFSMERWEFLLIDDTLPAVADKFFSFTDNSHIALKSLRNLDSETNDVVSSSIDLESLPWKDENP